MEIGSEFWLDKTQNGSSNGLSNLLSRFGETVLTSSGRGAISLLLQQVNPKNKTALLPAYICDSVILPFIEHGYSCYFYEIDESLSPDIESIKSFKNIGIFLHMGYYGFSTNSNLLSFLHHIKDQSTIIIEDVTHTLFSKIKRIELNDFYIGSIRKWFGLPSGGFLASPNRINKRPIMNHDSLVNLRAEALLTKGKYMETKDEGLKNLFLNQFSKAEDLLDRDTEPYGIDRVSMELINSLDSKDLISKRRDNFNTLHDGLKKINYLQVLFEKLPKSICPMFYPLLIKSNRDNIRIKLIQERIYCPIHWPIPIQIKANDFESTLVTYNNILSIPCDQRYGKDDMERIVSVFKAIQTDMSTTER